MTEHPHSSRHGILSLSNWILAFTLVCVFQGFFADSLNPYIYSIIMYAGINIILAVSLNLVNGFTGQFSMGHAGFMSVGAYTSAAISTYIHSHLFALPFNPFVDGAVLLGCLMSGGLVAALAGLIVGLPSLRLKGDYLAIVTLGFGEIIRVVILNIESVGGARGLPNIPSLSHFGWVYTFVIIVTFSIWRISRSAHGRAFLAVREDEIAAEAMGVNTTVAKVRAFVIGSFFAGIAGGLFAHYLRYLNPQIFDFNRSFEIIICVVLGGMGSISGSIFAALFLTVMKEALRPLQELTKIDFRMILYSIMLIALMLTRPNGLFGGKEIFQLFPKTFFTRLYKFLNRGIKT